MADTFKPDPAKTAQDAAEDKRKADAKLEADRRQADVDARAVAAARTGIRTPGQATSTVYPDHPAPAAHRAGVEMVHGVVQSEDQKVAERHGVVPSVEQGVAEMTPHLKKPSEAQVRQDAPQTLEPPVNPKAYAPDSTALAAVKNARRALKDFNYSGADEHLVAAERLLDPVQSSTPRQPAPPTPPKAT